MAISTELSITPLAAIGPLETTINSIWQESG
jgi:hypothetical protein